MDARAKNKRMWQTLFAIVLTSIMLLASHTPRLNHLQNALRTPFAWVYGTVNWPLEKWQAVGKWRKDKQKLLEENQALAQKVLQMQASILQNQQLSADNKELRALLRLAPSHAQKWQLAQVLALKLDHNNQQFLLDLGKKDGIVAGQAVVNGRGVVGQVVAVNPESSIVRAITEPNQAIAVQIQNNGARAIAKGRQDHLSIQTEQNEQAADIGSMVYASGLGQVYPPGYPVGTIVSNQPIGDSQKRRLTVQPITGVQEGKWLLVVPLQSVQRGSEE